MTTKTIEGLPEQTLAAFNGDELRARIFFEKYALRDQDDRPVELVPQQMWARLAREIASVEPDEPRQRRWESEFLWLLSDFRFLPGGRIMHGAGNPRKVTLHNCYVEQIRADSIDAIWDAAKHAAKTYSRGGGIGIDVSPLRPAGARVRNAARKSTGAVSFMELYSLTTGLIGQSGRRGALMLTIADHHPDVLEFCRIKRNLTGVRYANISVRVSDAFMRAVENGGEWILWFENDEVGCIEGTIRARELWDEMIAGARDWAEPGCLFWDTIKRYGTSEYNGMEVVTTNPCAEQALEHGGCCDLGSINLERFVVDAFTPDAYVNKESLERAVRAAVRFLDNVHDCNRGRHALPHQEEAAMRGRRVGVGILGLGDTLVKLGLRYGANEVVAYVEDLMREIKETAYDASVELAKEKGPFPAFDPDKHLAQQFFERFPQELVERIRRHGLRNVSVLTVPPVGSGAALAGVTNGLEPIFALTYVRRSESLSQEYFRVLHPLVAEYVATRNIPVDPASLAAKGEEADAILRQHLPPAFVVAHEIDPLKRVAMQAALQRHIDQAISSTINLPRDASAETVGRIYFHAWRAGLKGISVYREGSREGVLITAEEAKRSHQIAALSEKVVALAKDAVPELVVPDGGAPPDHKIETVVRQLVERIRRAPQPEQLQMVGEVPVLRPRPEILYGVTLPKRAPEGGLQITINEVDGQPFELIIHGGKAGTSLLAMLQGLARIASLWLRAQRLPSPKARVEMMVDQLVGIRGGNQPVGFGPRQVLSAPDAIGKTLDHYLQIRYDGSAPDDMIDVVADPDALGAGGSRHNLPNGDICPRCQNFSLRTHEGCTKCDSCGYQEC